MKNTLLALALATLLVAPTAQADSFSMSNQAGGRIVLTDRPCDDQVNGAGLLQAYTFTDTGAQGKGCWTIIDNLVHIGWGEGKRSVFPQDRFIAEPAPKPAKQPKPVRAMKFS